VVRAVQRSFARRDAAVTGSSQGRSVGEINAFPGVHKAFTQEGYRGAHVEDGAAFKGFSCVTHNRSRWNLWGQRGAVSSATVPVIRPVTARGAPASR